MIQRIQTIYLLLASILVAVTLFTPSMTLAYIGSEYTIKAFEISHTAMKSYPTMAQGIMLIITALLPLITIFLYKNRKWQMRLCGVEIVGLSANIAFIAAYTSQIWDKIKVLPNAAFSIKVGAIMPLIALILIIMAMCAINSDEKLVRSLNRIR